MTVKKTCSAALSEILLDAELEAPKLNVELESSEVEADLPTGPALIEVPIQDWNNWTEKYGFGYTLPDPTNQAAVVLGDDGWIEANYLSAFRGEGTLKARNSLVSWFVLQYPNIFGNTLRFTDILGGTTFNDYVIDHITGLAYSPTGNPPRAVIATAIIDSLGTDFGGNNSAFGYTDWFLCNIPQLYGIKNKSFNKALSYPLYTLLNNADAVYTSTHEPGSATDYNQIQWRNAVTHLSDATRPYIYCRKHF